MGIAFGELNMSMKVLKQPIIELQDIVVQFPSRDGSIFNPKIYCYRWY